jgi:hypothetical protein
MRGQRPESARVAPARAVRTGKRLLAAQAAVPIGLAAVALAPLVSVALGCSDAAPAEESEPTMAEPGTPSGASGDAGTQGHDGPNRVRSPGPDGASMLAEEDAGMANPPPDAAVDAALDAKHDAAPTGPARDAAPLPPADAASPSERVDLDGKGFIMRKWNGTEENVIFDGPTPDRCFAQNPAVLCTPIGVVMVYFHQGKFRFTYNFHTGSDYSVDGTYALHVAAGATSGTLDLTFTDGYSCTHNDQNWHPNATGTTTNIRFLADGGITLTANDAANDGQWVPLDTNLASGPNTIELGPITATQFFGDEWGPTGQFSGNYRWGQDQCGTTGAACNASCVPNPPQF